MSACELQFKEVHYNTGHVFIDAEIILIGNNNTTSTCNKLHKVSNTLLVCWETLQF